MHPLKWLLTLAVAGIAAAGLFIYTGVYHIGADAPHHPITLKLIETLRERSIAVRAEKIIVPPNLFDNERVRRGAGNYEAMCTGCHLKPGMQESEMRLGLYPQPPKLAEYKHDEPAMQFWAIKHGIKMTAMPAWSKGGMDDETIWDMVALLQTLPDLSTSEYQQLVASSEGHAHAGVNGSAHGQSDAHHESASESMPMTEHPHQAQDSAQPADHHAEPKPAMKPQSHDDTGSKPHAH